MRRALVALIVVASGLVPAAAGGAGEPPGVLLIMDASGSMNRTIGGETLLDTAKKALRELVERLPADARVGLRVYGHRASSDDPQSVGCADTELIIPVGPIDRAEILGAIDDYQASGWTPIGLSLQEAVEDLGEAGGTIVLVSDGEDTCPPPPPCEVARQLAQEGYVTRVHTVGLALQDEAAAEELQCVADVTHGTFTDVEDAAFLLESLSGVVTGAIEGRELPYVLGSLERSSAPLLRWRVWEGNPDWLEAWTESAIQTGETRWMAVDVEEGFAMAASATIDWQPEAGPEEYLEVTILDEDGFPVGVANEIAGVMVEAPQRMYLAEAANWYPSMEGWLPGATAVVDPPSMFPAWESDAEWFQPTVARFHDAGLNGGIYQLWKQYTPGASLPPGRYFVGVTWEAGREDVSGMGVGLTLYPIDETSWGWRSQRLEAAHVVIEPFASEAIEPIPLDLLAGSGRVVEGLGTLGRSAEVWWAAVPGESVDMELELGAGESLFVGWDVVLPWGGGGEVDVELRGPDGDVVEPEPGDPMGFGGSVTFRAPTGGTHTLTTALAGVAAEDEPAIAVAVHVFEPAPGEDDSDGVDGGVTMHPPADLPVSVWAAVMAGLQAVRDAVG